MSIKSVQHSPQASPPRSARSSKHPLPKKRLNFGSVQEPKSPPRIAAMAPHVEMTPPSKKRDLDDAFPLLTEGQENAAKRFHTAAKVETSFRAFLSSFPETTSTTTSTATTQLKPPPLKKGQLARMSVQDRLASLEKSDIAPEKLDFIRAAAVAAESIPQNTAKLGQGTFSNVYLIPSTADSPASVMKVFKEYCSIGATANPLQGTQRLYQLSQASEAQFNSLRAAYTNDQFPVDVLEITNLSSWRQDGYFTQPLVTQMFEPSWNTFVEKVSLFGNKAHITDEEEALLKTIQSTFQKALKLNLCIDFKPENLGYISVEGEQQVVIIDTFGLSGNDPSDIKPMTRSNIKTFAGNSSAIHAFLSQVVPEKC